MANHNDIDIDRVAQLARVELTAEEKAKFSRQLGDVLQHITQLEQVDVPVLNRVRTLIPWSMSGLMMSLKRGSRLRMHCETHLLNATT